MRRLLVAALAAGTLSTAGCVSVSEGVDSLAEVSGDSVLVVGKIQIIPPIKQEEQRYKMGWDLFDSKRYFLGRAVLFMADTPEYRERTSTALNPPLEQTWFLKLPRAERFMVKGSVTMELVTRQGNVSQAELLFPRPITLDIRPGDKAVYVGTLRLHRDEFHEVTRAEVRDEYAQAAAEFRKKFPSAALPRRALLKPAR